MYSSEATKVPKPQPVVLLLLVSRRGGTVGMASVLTILRVLDVAETTSWQ